MHNTRILIIDDEEIVRDSIREILNPRVKDESLLEEAAMDLFDEEEPIISEDSGEVRTHFILEEASSGKMGLEKVKAANEAGNPYAVVFLDMRMPGWDGLKTCVEIRKVDSKAQVFFITAFSDHSIEKIVAQAGSDVGYLSKPFVQEEILQLATKGVHDWARLTNLERLLEIIGQIGFGENQLHTLLENILHQISDYVGTDCALLGRIGDEQDFEILTRIGTRDINVSALMDRVNLAELDRVKMMEGVLICPLSQYFILAVPSNKENFNQEKLYLLHLFVENAVRAIQNSELSAQLLQREKLSAMGQAISMVMHDIRTPISQIQSMVEMIQDDPEDTEEVVEMSKDIEAASNHAMDIILDVRDFVRNAELEKEPIDLSPYLDGILDIYNKQEDATPVTFEVEAPTDLEVMGDARKLRRAIVNLVNNACEAMRDHAVSDPYIRLLGMREHDHVRLSIQDNGPGIPEDIRKNLFQPFVTHGKENGTGLGLAIVKQIVEAHKGQISVDSSSSGTAFHISLPLN